MPTYILKEGYEQTDPEPIIKWLLKYFKYGSDEGGPWHFYFIPAPLRRSNDYAYFPVLDCIFVINDKKHGLIFLLNWKTHVDKLCDEVRP